MSCVSVFRIIYGPERNNYTGWLWEQNPPEAGCTKSAKECKFEHKKLSPAEAAKLVKPAGRDSRATSPGTKAKPGAKAKPGPKGKPKAGPKSPSYCFKYASPQSCNDRNCQFMHLPEDMVAEYKRSQGELRKLYDKKP